MKGEGIDRDELAILLGVSYDQASEILLAECGDGLDVRSRVNADGEDEWNLEDVQRIVERRRRDPRTFATRRSLKPKGRRSHTPPAPASRESEPLPPEVRFSSGPNAILFSDDQGGSSGSQSTAGISLADAAEQAGLTEDEMTTRVLGRARLKVVDGQMVVSQADLNRLAAEGSVPKPSERAKVDAMVAEVEGKPSSDPAADRRTEAMAGAIGVQLDGPTKPSTRDQDRTAAVAAAIGVELEPASKPDDDDQEQKPQPPSSGAVISKAEDRKPYRLGAPKRWGER
jgi:hypothetical protein